MKKKIYKKFSEAQIKKLKKYYAMALELQETLTGGIFMLESDMRKDMKLDLFIFFDDFGCIAGIGSEDRSWELLQDDILG